MKNKASLVLFVLFLCFLLPSCSKEDPAVRSLNKKIEETKDLLMMHNALKDRDAAIGFFHKLMAANKLQFKTTDGKYLDNPEAVASYWLQIEVAEIKVSEIAMADVPGAKTDYDRDKKAHVTYEYTIEIASVEESGLGLFSTFWPEFFNPFMTRYAYQGIGTATMEFFHIKRCTSD